MSSGARTLTPPPFSRGTVTPVRLFGAGSRPAAAAPNPDNVTAAAVPAVAAAAVAAAPAVVAAPVPVDSSETVRRLFEQIGLQGNLLFFQQVEGIRASLRDRLNDGKVECVDGSAVLGASAKKIIVIAEGYFVVAERIGRGGNSDVFAGALVDLDQSSVYRSQFVWKQGRKKLPLGRGRSENPFLQERRAVNGLTPQKFSCPIRAYEILSPRKTTRSFACVEKRFSQDADHVSYSPASQPVQKLILLFARFSSTIESLHTRSRVHRDIKGANFFVAGNITKSALGDNSSIVPVQDQIVRTFGTPGWIDPLMFMFDSRTPRGSSPLVLVNKNERFINHILRKGVQKESSDVYSFGMSMEYSGVYRLCNSLVDFLLDEDLKQEIKNDLTVMFRRTAYPRFVEDMTREELLQLEQQDPCRYLVVYDSIAKKNRLYHWQNSQSDRKVIFEKVLNAFENNGLINPAQKMAIMQFIDLAYRAKSLEFDELRRCPNRPKIEEIAVRLMGIHQQMIQALSPQIPRTAPRTVASPTPDVLVTMPTEELAGAAAAAGPGGVRPSTATPPPAKRQKR